jgi:hypothetical protein
MTSTIVLTAISVVFVVNNLHLGRDGTALPLERAIRALNAEATRQVAMVAYIDDFELMIITIVALPLLLLLRRPRRIPGPAAAAGD